MRLFFEFRESMNKDIIVSNTDTINMLENQLLSQRMVENLVNDLLDMAKMENFSFQLNEKYFNLSHLITQALNMVVHTSF